MLTSSRRVTCETKQKSFSSNLSSDFAHTKRERHLSKRLSNNLHSTFALLQPKCVLDTTNESED